MQLWTAPNPSQRLYGHKLSCEWNILVGQFIFKRLEVKPRSLKQRRRYSTRQSKSSFLDFSVGLYLLRIIYSSVKARERFEKCLFFYKLLWQNIYLYTYVVARSKNTSRLDSIPPFSVQDIITSTTTIRRLWCTRNISSFNLLFALSKIYSPSVRPPTCLKRSWTTSQCTL